MNILPRLGDTAERIGASIAALARSIRLNLEFHWAEFRGDHIRALTLMRKIIMADLSALTAAVDRVAAKVAADAAALQDAQNANANLQPDIDALTAKLDQLAPAPVDLPQVEDPAPVVQQDGAEA